MNATDAIANAISELRQAIDMMERGLYRSSYEDAIIDRMKTSLRFLTGEA